MAERPEDLNLPTAVITRIIKDALPEGVNVAKDARLAISKAASVFVLYATSCANNFSMQNKRKTISGPDVIDAVTEMEFEKFAEPLKICLEAFRKEQKGKKEVAERKKKDKEQNTSKEGNEVEMEAEEEEKAEEEEEGKEEEEEEAEAAADEDGASDDVVILESDSEDGDQ